MKDNSRYKLAECLHLLADIITTATSDEVLTTLEKMLRQAKKDIMSGREIMPKRQQSKATMENTAPAQESLAFQENTSALSIKEFGRDVTNEVEFPTRRDLFDFALAQGVQVTTRDNKASIRKRLLARAELRNMDKLVAQGKGQ